MSLVFRGCSDEIPIIWRPLRSKVSSMDDTIPNGGSLNGISFCAVGDLVNTSMSLHLSTRAPNLSLTASLRRFFTNVSFSARSFRAILSWTVPCGLYGLFRLIPLVFGNSAVPLRCLQRISPDRCPTSIPHFMWVCIHLKRKESHLQ